MNVICRTQLVLCTYCKYMRTVILAATDDTLETAEMSYIYLRALERALRCYRDQGDYKRPLTLRSQESTIIFFSLGSSFFCGIDYLLFIKNKIE